MKSRAEVVLLLMLVTGCGGASRVVRLDTGQGESIVLIPRSADAKPVELGEDDFQKAASKLARDVRTPARPQEAARRLFEVAARSGAYVYEPRGHRIRPLGPGEHLTEELPEAEVELTRSFAPGAVAMVAPGTNKHRATRTPPTGYRAWGSFSGFKSAMGSAGAGKEWHHIVEKTPGNVQRFGPQALHNTENVVPLDKTLHTRISALYSSVRFDITNTTMTVRKWLSSQSLQAQREFGLQAMENVRRGSW
jgi:hypothetical protein